MARKRAQARVAEGAAANWLPPSARVAWAYLAVLLAAVGAGLLVVVLHPGISGLICGVATTSDDAAVACSLGVGIWLSIAAFLVALAPSVRVLKLDWWLWLALAAGNGALIMAADAVGEWWWWLIAALLPAAAALISADWERGRRFRGLQRTLICTLAAASAIGVAIWFING